MRIFDNLRTLRNADADAADYLEDTTLIPADNTSFMEYLGGSAYFIENKDDLAKVYEANKEIDLVSPYKDLVVMFVCNNNSGGPTYFVPRHLYSDRETTLLNQFDDLPF